MLLLLVNIVIIGGIVVSIGYLYGAGIYTHYDWVLGVVIITLNCIAVLYTFAGYAVIASKKLYRGVLAGATTTQVASTV